MELDIICLQFEYPQLVWLQHCLGVFWLISKQPLPNFLQEYKTPCCWTFCKLFGLAHCYQPFLYSSGIDICICLISFPYDIYDKFTHHYPTYGLLYVEFRFGICICVCQGCQTLFMISSIQGCHFPHCLLCEQRLILKPCCHFPLSVIWLDSTGFGHITL